MYAKGWKRAKRLVQLINYIFGGQRNEYKNEDNSCSIGAVFATIIA